MKDPATSKLRLELLSIKRKLNVLPVQSPSNPKHKGDTDTQRGNKIQSEANEQGRVSKTDSAAQIKDNTRGSEKKDPENAQKLLISRSRKAK